MRHLTAALLLPALLACSSGSSSTRSSPPSAVQNKAEAPLDLVLSTASVGDGEVQVALVIRARADVPRAVARFVPPEGCTLKDGAVETDLGALHAGEERTLVATLRVPAREGLVLAAGVDVHLATGVKLNASRTAALGAAAPAAPAGKVIQLPNGESVRMQNAQ
ncbi:MAG: hypothetical protein HY904_24370 [Deltaproteobacteria bacterium]|nr:hypothetical protein [Deltaproteobacteria bacterium]